MEIQGRIIAVLPPRTGVSAKGTAWQVNGYVIETDEHYPKKVAFDVFGADKAAEYNIQSGETLRVYFDIDAREYQGKWFNSVRAWKVERPGNGQTTQPTQPETVFTQQQQPQQQSDDLPF